MDRAGSRDHHGTCCCASYSYRPCLEYEAPMSNAVFCYDMFPTLHRYLEESATGNSFSQCSINCSRTFIHLASCSSWVAGNIQECCYLSEVVMLHNTPPCFQMMLELRLHTWASNLSVSHKYSQGYFGSVYSLSLCRW